ncbi:MAG: magnesium/cobalt transporter CorA [Luteolibacter sp.]
MECLLYIPATKELHTGGEELVGRWMEDSAAIIWLRFTGELGEDSQQLLRDKFGIHRLALQDATRDRHPPKLEEFADHTFLIFKTLTGESTDTKVATLQSILFVGERFLITRSSQPCKAVAKVWKAELKNPIRFRKGPDALASRLMRLYVDGYMEILLQLETKLEELETGLLDKVDDSVLAVVTGYKGRLKRLRRIFLYHEQMLRDLRMAKHKGFRPERIHELTDVYEQQERANSLTLLYYELASDLIDGYLSLSSHRLNQIMKVLTIVTVVFVPLGFLAGIYGMNFEYMPELHSRSGYYILLSVMASIAIVLLLSFKRRKWL